MSNESDLSVCVERWRTYFRDDHLKEQFWEGPKAYNELKRHGLLARVRLREADDTGQDLEHFIAEHALPQICQEVSAYRERMLQIRNTIESTKNLDEWLEQQARACRTKAARLRQRYPETASTLEKLSGQLDGERRFLKYQQKQSWMFPMAAGGVHFRVLRMRPVPLQERELDSRFQLRLAFVLRVYLRKDYGISLTTIARLVVLFLVCAGLAQPNVGEVRLLHNGHPVSVRNVLQKLRRGGLK